MKKKQVSSEAVIKIVKKLSRVVNLPPSLGAFLFESNGASQNKNANKLHNT